MEVIRVKIIPLIVALMFPVAPLCSASQPAAYSDVETRGSVIKESHAEKLEDVLILELQRKIMSVLQEDYFKPNSGGYSFERFTVKELTKTSHGYRIKVEGKIQRNRDNKTDRVLIWFEHTHYRGFVPVKLTVTDGLKNK